jgi:hypothetical protein
MNRQFVDVDAAKASRTQYVYSDADRRQDMQYSSGPNYNVHKSIAFQAQKLGTDIKNTFTPTGNVQEDKARGEA